MRLLTITFLACLLFASCGKKESVIPPPQPASNNACESSSDCPAGKEICDFMQPTGGKPGSCQNKCDFNNPNCRNGETCNPITGTCQPSCSSSNQVCSNLNNAVCTSNTAQNGYCRIPSTNGQTNCSSDADCPTQFGCVNGFCHIKCNTNADCPSSTGQVCDQITKTCEIGCIKQTNCQNITGTSNGTQGFFSSNCSLVSGTCVSSCETSGNTCPGPKRTTCANISNNNTCEHPQPCTPPLESGILNICYPGCSNLNDCQKGQTCSQGKCFSEFSQSLLKPISEIKIASLSDSIFYQAIGDSCNSDNDCDKNSEVCDLQFADASGKEGTCRKICKSNADCDSQVCNPNFSACEPTCEPDSKSPFCPFLFSNYGSPQCQANENRGYCSLSNCTLKGCPSQLTCDPSDNICKRPCSNSNPCPESQSCTSQTSGICITTRVEYINPADLASKIASANHGDEFRVYTGAVPKFSTITISKSIIIRGGFDQTKGEQSPADRQNSNLGQKIGQNVPSQTVIDAGSQPAFIISSGTVTIDGFQIKHAKGNSSALPKNCSSDMNIKETAGAITVCSGATATLKNLRLSKNTTSEKGGAIRNFGTLTLEDSYLDLNTANQGGGGLSHEGTSSTVKSTTFYGNGAVNDPNGSPPPLCAAGGLSPCPIVDSKQLTCPTDGGACTLACTKQADCPTGYTCSTNSGQCEPPSLNGGAVYAKNNKLTVSSSRFVSNYAYLNGGAIYSDGPLDAYFSLFANNWASNAGGGLYLAKSNSGKAKLENLTVIDNQAYNKGGGGIFNEGVSGSSVKNSLFRNNKGLYAVNNGAIAEWGGNRENSQFQKIDTNSISQVKSFDTTTMSETPINNRLTPTFTDMCPIMAYTFDSSNPRCKSTSTCGTLASGNPTNDWTYNTHAIANNCQPEVEFKNCQAPDYVDCTPVLTIQGATSSEQTPKDINGQSFSGTPVLGAYQSGAGCSLNSDCKTVADTCSTLGKCECGSTGSTCPSDKPFCQKGSCQKLNPNYRHIFVSSREFKLGLGYSSPNGVTFASATDADSACGDMAAAQSLPGTWKAVLNDETSSTWTRLNNFNTNDTRPIYLVDDATQVASSMDGLGNSSLLSPVFLTEQNKTYSGGVFTGYNTSATTIKAPSAHLIQCSNWTDGTNSNDGYVGIGLSTAADSNWCCQGSTNTCASGARIYCLEL